MQQNCPSALAGLCYCCLCFSFALLLGREAAGLALAFMVLGSSQVSPVPFSLTSMEPLFPESRLGWNITK